MASPSPTTASERALALMRQLNVAPTPRNYHVFFACVSGVPVALSIEVEMMVNSKAPFTEEALERLYQTHLAGAESNIVEDTTTNVKKILAEMMETMASFTGATQEVSKKMAAELGDLNSGELTPEKLKRMASAVVDGAKSIKSSSDAIEKKLEVAQQEVVALKENLTKATEESEKDFLTGCYNRKAFDKRVKETISDANLNSGALALLMIDVDHFKSFNDNYGHQIGDEVLKIVAKALTDSVKGMDIVARYGGEEFAVILPRTPVGGGMIVAEGIRKMIASKELKRRSTGESYGAITVSIGVAAFRANVDTPEQLIKRADEALYRSKKSGRNRVTQEDLSAPR